MKVFTHKHPKNSSSFVSFYEIIFHKLYLQFCNTLKNCFLSPKMSLLKPISNITKKKSVFMEKKTDLIFQMR